MIKFIRSEFAMILGLVALAVFYGPATGLFVAPFATMLFAILFVVLFSIMLMLSFGAVRHADHLAEMLGEPYGTLILTIAVITIEVSLISALMLSGDSNPELARDTMMAVMMIVLNGVVGMVLVVGGFFHREQAFNLQGARAFLAVLVTLATMSLILPKFTESTPDPSLSRVQSELFALITVALYLTFLAIQTMRHRAYFMQPGETEHQHHERGHHSQYASRSIGFHAILLVVTLLPAVLLSKKLAILVEYGIDGWGLPAALGGIVIAMLVLAPEGLAAIASARQNALQRAVNICLGSALATIGLTVPAALAISLVINQPIVLGLSDTDMVLLVLTMFVSGLTFGGVRTNMLQGAVHLVIFFVYLVLIFNP